MTEENDDHHREPNERQSIFEEFPFSCVRFSVSYYPAQQKSVKLQTMINRLDFRFIELFVTQRQGFFFSFHVVGDVIAVVFSRQAAHQNWDLPAGPRGEKRSLKADLAKEIICNICLTHSHLIRSVENHSAVRADFPCTTLVFQSVLRRPFPPRWRCVGWQPRVKSRRRWCGGGGGRLVDRAERKSKAETKFLGTLRQLFLATAAPLSGITALLRLKFMGPLYGQRHSHIHRAAINYLRHRSTA